MSFDVRAIAALHRGLTARWHLASPAVEGVDQDLLRLVAENHLRNFHLWHEEDIARRDDLGFEAVYRAKRAIDRFNQERNDFIEKIDQAIADTLPSPDAGCPHNSETPGMIIDRLSILALKEYHMLEETRRPDATSDHRAGCGEKLAQIRRQHADLVGCLAEFMADIAARRRTFAVYFQFKMYNDPTLNPQLYRPAGPAQP